MSDKILLIEIKDKEISCLLNNLRIIFNKRRFSTGIHITIKGPQKTFRQKAINKFIDINEPIYIKDVGMFANGKNFIVYMKVKCEGLKGYMWNKIDYEDEYNPHITLYNGSDKKIAETVYNFLMEESLSLMSYKYDIVVRSLTQRNLFSPSYSEENCDFKNLIDKGWVKRGILSRARKIFDKAQNKIALTNRSV